MHDIHAILIAAAILRKEMSTETAIAQAIKLWDKIKENPNL